MYRLKHLQPIQWFILLLICLGGSVLGIEPDSGNPIPFPVTQEIKGESVLCNGKIVSRFMQTFKVDQTTGTIQIAILSTTFEFKGYFTQGLRVKKSEFVFNNFDYIQYLGYDKRVTVWEENANRIKVEYLLNGRLKTTRYFNGTNAIDSDSLLFFLQGMLLKGNGDFNNQVISLKEGIKVEAKFKLVEQEVNDLTSLAPQYELVPNIQKSLTNHKIYIYIMEFTGLTRLVYPYKFYFVYEKEPPHSLLAYWGGPFQDAEYAYTLNL